MAKTDKAYQFPIPINPGNFKCAKVFIPDHPYYFAAFWASYEYLANWRAWQQDEDHNAKDVAAIWRVAFKMARIYWPDQEGDCEMPYLLRDDPNDPCKVQQSIDGGTTWTHAFTKECGEDIPTTTDEDIASQMAGNFLYNIFVYPMQQYEIDPVNNLPDIQNWLNNLITGEPGGTGLPDLEEVLSFLTPEQIAELKDPCFYESMKDNLEVCGGSDVIDWVDCVGDNLTDWIDNHVSDYWSVIMDWIDGLTQDVLEHIVNFRAPDGEGGLSFAAQCDTTADECRDMHFSPGGFAKTAGQFGVWVDGVGWKGQLDNSIPKWVLDVTLTDLPVGSVGNVEVRYAYTAPGKEFYVWINGVQVVNQTGGNAGSRYNIIAVGEPITDMRIRIKQGTLNSTLLLTEVCFIP